MKMEGQFFGAAKDNKGSRENSVNRLNIVQHCLILVIWLAVLVQGNLQQVHAQNIETFDIAPGSLIEPDQPSTGAGRIEEEGGQDIYVFDGLPGQTVFLDMISHDPGFRRMTWTVVGPDESVLSFECFLCQDPGFIRLTRTGKYQIIVGTPALAETGSYSFQLLDVPDPDIFQVQFGEMIGPDQPWDGAGRIESPGASDRYQFEVESGQRFIFRLLRFDPSLDTVNWSLQSPTLGTLYFGDLIRYRPRILTLEETGLYELVIGDRNNSATGEYELVLEGIPAPDEIQLDLSEAVEIFNDGSGAGFIENSAAKDIYHWTMEEPGWIFLDLKAADKGLQFSQWELFGPANQKVYSKFFYSGDPGLMFLESAGDYQMVIGGNLDSGTGEYRIHVQPVPAREEFHIAIGDEVHLNLPGAGAGNIHVPGAQDVYTFSAEPGQEIFLEVLQTERSLGFLTWQLVDDSGAILFDECLRCIDPGKYTLEKGGEYTLLVGGFQHAGTGAYSFRLWDVPAPHVFQLTSDQSSILPDKPSAGAGRLESPGARDVYLIEGTKGQVLSFSPTLANQAQNLNWKFTLPGGGVFFDTPFRATATHTQFLTLPLTGTYLLEFYNTSSKSPEYGFDFTAVDGCSVSADGSQLPLPQLTIVLPTPGTVFNQNAISVQGTIGLTPGSKGTDLLLVLDSSESLRSNDPEDLRRQAVSDFITSLPRGVNIRLGLVDFDHSARLLQPLTENFEDVLSTLESLDQSGGTDIKQALEVSLEEMVDQIQPGVAQNIILFSDGESSVGSPAEAAFRSRDLGIKIHTVYLGDSSSEGSFLLQSISNASCGNFKHAKSASQLVEIFRNIANPVPIDRMELVTSASPDEIQNVSFGGQFWRAVEVPISTEPGSTTLLTVRLFTDENPTRIAEQFVEVKFQDAANQAPVLAPIRNRTLFEDTSTSFLVEVSDPDHPIDSLIWTIESDRPDILPPDEGWNLVSIEDQFELHLQPVPDAFGVVNINVIVQDPEGASSEQTFRVSIRPVNDPPTLDPIENVIINPEERQTTIPLTGISDGSVWESQVLEFGVELSDTSVFSSAEISHLPDTSEGVLLLHSIEGAEGVTTITMTLSDGQGANSTVVQTFTATLLPKKNEPPSIEWVKPSGNFTFFEGEEIHLQVLAVDPEGEIQQITFFANNQIISESSNVAPEISWVPPQLGTLELRAEVKDSKLSKASTPILDIEIIERPVEFSLSIQSPTDAFVACVGDTVEVEVQLAGGAPEGTVVHLFAGDRLQGVRNSAPYSFQWEVEERGDFLVTAHAFREDGSVVKSEPIRAGISDTCRQTAILVSGTPVEDPMVIQDWLFEMGIGTTILSVEEASAVSLSGYDLVLGLEDSELGISSLLVDRMWLAHADLNLPIGVLGHHLASRTDTLSEIEKAQWHQLIHLQSFGDDWLGDVFQLQETGFFRTILQGAYGTVESFALPASMDRAIADESAEVIAFTGETDAFIRFPAGTEPDFDQPRKIIQNFPLIEGGDQHSMLQRKRLFQNAICWSLRCSACASANIELSILNWQDQAGAGEVFHQSLKIENTGVCELTAGKMLIQIPEGLVLEDVEMSKGLGWYQEPDDPYLTLNLGRMPSGDEGDILVQLSMRSLTPGDYSVQICAQSIHSQPNCIDRDLTITGQVLTPPQISIGRGEGGGLFLIINGQEGVQYRVESSLDFTNWEILGSASGVETSIPLPTNQNGVPITLFYRASIAP